MNDDMIVNEVEGLPSGFIPHLAVCEKITGKDSKLQRFVSELFRIYVYFIQASEITSCIAKANSKLKNQCNTLFCA